MSTQESKSPVTDQTLSQLIDAGIGLAMLPFSLAQKTFTLTKEETSSRFAALHARGEQVDAKIREIVNPVKFCNTVKESFSTKAAKQAKIAELSEKIDTLVELIATVAAKQAAESKTTAEAKPAPRKRAPRATTAKTKTPAKPRASRATTHKKDD